ncbi:hypothetical protein F4859DRAFT_498329 [Xylaria cf. heliscus]|nr:hypothetical protein F4859DRAFT_498329 [Xylaria cf. heliscus]
MADDSLYILNRSDENDIEQETYRLDFQHHFFDDMMNNELLPRHITTELAANPSPRICDVATGSGIWLGELARTLPASAELVGLDFDSSKFPRPEALPSNIRLGFGNLYKPFPGEYRDRFDVVHLRHFHLAAKKDHGVFIAQNLLSLLRPGGWLVWTETSPILASAQPPSDALFLFQKVYFNYWSGANDTNLPLAMASYMRQAGLVECDDRSYNCGSVLFGPKGADWLAKEHFEFLDSLKRMLEGVLTKGGVDGMRTQQDLDQLVAKLEEDMTGTRRFHIPVIRAWGREPL